MADTPLHRLSFRRYAYTVVHRRNLQNRWRPPPPEEMDLIVPVIDGRTLKNILGFDGLPGLPAQYVEPNATQWSGPASYGDDGLSAIIDGGCGVVGCCGVQASVSFENDTVRWSGFTVGTADPDGRAFEFDRVEYEQAIAGLATLPAVAVRVKVGLRL